jgi:hypothetical protein
VTIVDVIFFIAGAVVIIYAIVYSAKYQEIMQQATALRDLRLDTIAPLIVFCAITTLVCAFLGLLGIYKNIRPFLFVYLVTVFALIVIEIAMSVFMSTLSANNVQGSFTEDSDAGYNRRYLLQSYLKCCGWNYLTQEFLPERVACAALNPTFSQTCFDAATTFISSTLNSVYASTIVVTCLSSVAFVFTLIVVMKGSGKEKEDYFDNAYMS